MQALITDPQRPDSTRVGEMPPPPADDATVLDWNSAVEHLDRARDRWPEALEEFIGLRVPLDGFGDGFSYRGVKATLQLGSRG